MTEFNITYWYKDLPETKREMQVCAFSKTKARKKFLSNINRGYRDFVCIDSIIEVTKEMATEWRITAMKRRLAIGEGLV